MELTTIMILSTIAGFLGWLNRQLASLNHRVDIVETKMDNIIWSNQQIEKLVTKLEVVETKMEGIQQKVKYDIALLLKDIDLRTKESHDLFTEMIEHLREEQQ